MSGVDGGSNTKSNGYALSVPNPSGASLTFDANGNMTSDGTSSYAWDAENRLIKITYAGSGNYSQFAYDGLGRNVLIQEYTSSSLTSTKIVCWVSSDRGEIRDGSGSIVNQYFALGQVDGSNKRFYALNHPGSVTEVTDNSGNLLGEVAYDPWGRSTQLQGSYVPDFGFDGYYLHARSRLNLTLHRAYDATLGRFTNRDPIDDPAFLMMPQCPYTASPSSPEPWQLAASNPALYTILNASNLLSIQAQLAQAMHVRVRANIASSNVNTYSYVANNPISGRDPSGLAPLAPVLPPISPYYPQCYYLCAHNLKAPPIKPGQICPRPNEKTPDQLFSECMKGCFQDPPILIEWF